MSDQRPTRIITEPAAEQLKNGYFRKLYTCDDGKTYSLRELASAIGMTPCGLWQMISRHGVDSPKVLLIGHVECGSAEWLKLSSSPRPGKISALRPIGTYEREMISFEGRGLNVG